MPSVLTRLLPTRRSADLPRTPQLVIPKHHGAKLTDIPLDHLSEVMVSLASPCLPHLFSSRSAAQQDVLQRLAKASGATDYNILQNNGRIAHQAVDHVHFHMIPKPNEQEGLGISWPMQSMDKEKMKALQEEMKAKM